MKEIVLPFSVRSARIALDKGAIKELVPVRPVAALAGGISLKSKQVIPLFWKMEIVQLTWATVDSP